MKVTPLSLPGAFVITPVVHRDERGFFLEAFHQGRYAEAGLSATFVQDNHSHSLRDVLRGLHAQVKNPQTKLVRVLNGRILDVIVDVRVGSPTFGRWEAVELSSENAFQLWVPAGFVHGFLVRSDEADVEYKCSALYDPTDEIGVAWNDPEIGIQWGTSQPLLSPRDRAHPPLHTWLDRLPHFAATSS